MPFCSLYPETLIMIPEPETIRGPFSAQIKREAEPPPHIPSLLAFANLIKFRIIQETGETHTLSECL